MTWLNVALAFLSPAAALTGAFLASVLQSRYSRRVEAVDNLTTLVHDVTRDFYPWIATYRIAGELDKHTKGLIISDKLNVLSAYRSRYSARRSVGRRLPWTVSSGSSARTPRGTSTLCPATSRRAPSVTPSSSRKAKTSRGRGRK